MHRVRLRSPRLHASSSAQSSRAHFGTSAVQAKMQRAPFKEVEGARDAFKTANYVASKTVNPDWKVGQGRVTSEHHSRSKDFRADHPKTVLSSADLSAAENYKMLVSGVVPRPIAFVSSQDSLGVRNLAPYSYFTVVSHNPPVIMFSSNAKGDGLKDSTSNILDTKRFTVNIISEPFIEAANYTSIDAPPNVDEWKLSGLTPVASSYWGKDGPPRVGESAYSMECELHDHLPIQDDDGKRTTTIIVGRVRNYVLNEGIRQADGAIDPRNLLPVSRAGGITYLRSNQGFELPRPTWKEEQNRQEVKALLDGDNT